MTTYVLPRFIALARQDSGGPLLVNAACIVCVQKHGNGSVIRLLPDASTYYVAESYEELMTKLPTGC